MKMEEKSSMEEKPSMEEKSSEKLLDAIGEIDDNLISGAANDTKKRKNWFQWGTLAAVLALCVSIGAFRLGSLNTGSQGAGTNPPSISIPEMNVPGTEAQNPDTESNEAAKNSIVILDVNPSIALTVNINEKIVSAEGLNEDGRAVLDGMDLMDVDITVAVNAIIGSMLQKGYLSDLQNAILVSVENEDTEKSTALQERVSSLIGTALQEGNLEGTVISQTLSDTADLEQMAKNNGISLGKAALIQEVMSQNQTLTIENLVPLSITEIALISQSQNLSSEALTQNGAASDKAYISQDAATEIAYGHANVKDGDISRIKVEFTSENGIMVYEVEFFVGTVEYEYDIDARTGQIVKYEMEDKGSAGQVVEKDKDKDKENQDSASQGGSPAQPVVATPTPTPQPTLTPASQPQYIGEEVAKEAALADAGVSADTVKYIKAWLEYDDGRPEHYEVEFVAGGIEYEYEIHLYSGAVLERKMEDYGAYHHGYGDGTAASTEDIGEEAAKNAALSHAGLTASEVRKLKVDYDYDDGIALYEVEFEYGEYEYEYKIGAATGAVLECKVDGDHRGYGDGTAASTEDIGEEAAKNAALSHAGLTASEVRKLKVDYDYDDGIALYEVEFEYGEYEYEYKIDAATGAILKYEIDD